MALRTRQGFVVTTGPRRVGGVAGVAPPAAPASTLLTLRDGSVVVSEAGGSPERTHAYAVVRAGRVHARFASLVDVAAYLRAHHPDDLASLA